MLIEEGRIALIDGDSIAFKYGSSEPDKIKGYLTERMFKLAEDTSSTSYHGFIGRGRETFRHKLYPDYKANRLGKTLPDNVSYVKDMLVGDFGFNEVRDIEAEDAVGLMLNKLGHQDCAICHIDSDLDQLEGYHWNYDKSIGYRISKDEAIKKFFSMVIEGSHKDHVKGLYMFKKADISFEGCISYQDYEQATLAIYRSYLTKAADKFSKYMPCFEPHLNSRLELEIEALFRQQIMLQQITTQGYEELTDSFRPQTF